jgi:hypothetical protein
MLLTFAFAQADAVEVKPLAGQAELICPACHESFQEAWETGAHANAAKNEVFQAEWDKQGKPGECMQCHTTGYDPETGTYKADAITCEACHDTTAANHPMEPMAADRSAKQCGSCHAETFFEWQASAHRESGLDCIGCHDPHGNQLKAQDSAQQCSSCHRDRASNFAMSAHSQQGMSCADCHLATLDGGGIEGHARLDHSFGVKLSTCNECHAYQMHDPSEVHPERATPQPPVDALAAVESSIVASEPSPVSPVGFAVLSGLFGLAAGAVIAPWVESIARRSSKK